MTGRIFDITEFTVNDGPGIRTTVFLKGCPLRCEWCHNPEGINPEPEMMTGNTFSKLAGRDYDSEDLAKILNKNKDIFAKNNGGVTFSGGEPLLQWKFLLEVLEKLEVHTAIETSGYADGKAFLQIINIINLTIIDVKMMDSQLHQKFTGVSNALILQNSKTLCENSAEFIVRIPVIPTVNDIDDNYRQVAEFIRNAKGLLQVELLPYHKSAGAKYAMLGKTYLPNFDVNATPHINLSIFEKYGIRSVCL